MCHFQSNNGVVLGRAEPSDADDGHPARGLDVLLSILLQTCAYFLCAWLPLSTEWYQQLCKAMAYNWVTYAAHHGGGNSLCLSLLDSEWSRFNTELFLRCIFQSLSLCYHYLTQNRSLRVTSNPWCQRLVCQPRCWQFFAQGDREKKLNLPVHMKLVYIADAPRNL